MIQLLFLVSEINQLQSLQNRAAKIITNSSLDAPSRHLIKGMGCKTIVFKSLNQLAPQFLFDLFTRDLLCSHHIAIAMLGPT